MSTLGAFDEPQWKWLEAVKGDSATPGIDSRVVIKNSDEVLGEVRVQVPAEFHHYVMSLHGPDVQTKGFSLQNRLKDRWYLIYWTKEPHRAYPLWYYTPSTTPAWAKRIIQRGR